MYIHCTTGLHIPLAYTYLYYYLLSPQYTILHILFYCKSYSYLIFLIIIIIYFFTYIYVYSLVLCYNILHCPLSGPDLTYISLLIKFCIIEYVTNKTLIPCRWWDLKSLCNLTLRNVVFKVFHNLFTHSFTDWRASAHLYFWETLPL